MKIKEEDHNYHKPDEVTGFTVARKAVRKHNERSEQWYQ
jgi:hypothetical protein